MDIHKHTQNNRIQLKTPLAKLIQVSFQNMVRAIVFNQRRQQLSILIDLCVVKAAGSFFRLT